MTRQFAVLPAIALALALVAPRCRAADIVDTAVAAGDFKTLATALGAAGLVETLKGPGPFTVFAPTDEAFAKLPAGTVESLLKAENKAKLTGILTYHVVPGKVLADQVVTLSGAKTVNGQRVDFEVVDGKVLVDGATVVITDIVCDNGVIHVIDAVILPVDQTIPEIATSAGQFSTLLAAVGAAGLAETLGGEGPFTVFAPTDEAFGSLPAGTIASLLEPANRAKLVDILKYHVVAGRVDSEAALAATSAATLLGPQVTITRSEAGAMINNARLVTADIDASNGVIHVIDRVLLPSAGNAVASTGTPTVGGRQMIETSIREGARLFNAGQHAACANLYMKTCEQLVELEMPAQVRTSMRSAMQTARSQHDMSSRAWTLRRAMESAYGQL